MEIKKLYDFNSEEGKKAVCTEYARLQQNCLSSSAETKMNMLDELAAHSGLKFSMTNEAAYRQPNALVSPQYELVELENDLDFSDAVASIPVNDNGLEQ